MLQRIARLHLRHWARLLPTCFVALTALGMLWLCTRPVDARMLGTFRTENLLADHNTTLGGSAADLTSINSSMLVGSNAQFSAGTSYTIGGQTPATTTQVAIVASDTHTAYEAIQLLIYNITGSYDTTAQPSTYWGTDVELEVNHAAGSNALTVAAYHCSAQISNAGSADSAECMSGTAGGGKIDIRDGAEFGGLTHVGGFAGTAELDSTGTDVNNYPLAASTSVLDINPSAPLFVTGFVNPTPTVPRFLTLCNRNDTFRVIVSPADGGSTAANQIFGPENFSGGSFPGYWIMSPRQCIDFKYDVAISRWVMRSSSGFTFPYVQVANHASAGVPGATWQSGTGDPNSVYNCAVGDLFSRLDGSTTSSLYVCTATNTWTAK